MTNGKEDEEKIPLWSTKVEDFEIWHKRLMAFKYSTEEGKRKTCAPKIYYLMINEKNYHKYEKYLHEISLDDLRTDDGVGYLFTYFKERAGVSDVQEIVAVVDNDTSVDPK